MSNGGVCRTAPATPGLLNILGIILTGYTFIAELHISKFLSVPQNIEEIWLYILGVVWVFVWL